MGRVLLVSKGVLMLVIIDDSIVCRQEITHFGRYVYFIYMHQILAAVREVFLSFLGWIFIDFACCILKRYFKFNLCWMLCCVVDIDICVLTYMCCHMCVDMCVLTYV